MVLPSEVMVIVSVCRQDQYHVIPLIRRCNHTVEHLGSLLVIITKIAMKCGSSPLTVSVAT